MQENRANVAMEIFHHIEILRKDGFNDKGVIVQNDWSGIWAVRDNYNLDVSLL